MLYLIVRERLFVLHRVYIKERDRWSDTIANTMTTAARMRDCVVHATTGTAGLDPLAKGLYVDQKHSIAYWSRGLMLKR